MTTPTNNPSVHESHAGTGNTPAGWRDLLAAKNFPLIVLLCFGVWLHAADELMVSTISPALTAELEGKRYVSWLIALYEVGSIVAGTLAAIGARRFGIATSMAGAALVYCAGCMTSALAPDMATMLGGRLVQGFGGGGMIAIAFVSVHRVADYELMPRIFALMSAVWGVSAFTGPMIGAAFAQAGWWRGAFMAFAVQALVFAVAAAIRLPGAERLETHEENSAIGSLALRALLIAASAVSVASAGVEPAISTSLGWLAAALALLAAFAALDRRAGATRLLPLRFTDPRSIEGAALATVLAMSISTTALIAYAPIITQQTLGLSPIGIGSILLLESVGWSVLAIAFSGLSRRHEAAAIIIGFMLVTVGVAGLIWAIAHGPVWLLALCALAQGGGFGIAWTYLVRRSVEGVGDDEKERIAAAIPTVQRYGYALGAALAGIVANASGFAESAGAEAAAYSAYWIFGLAALPALAGLLAAVQFTGVSAKTQLTPQE